MKPGRIVLTLFVCLTWSLTFSSAQKIEIRDGIRFVHNQGEGSWGKSPGATLQKIRTLGDIDAADETVAFYMPFDIALDAEGNLFVLDTGNHRIQKFSPSGDYLTTIGRKGQGPGEFNYPGSLDIDENGVLVVASSFIHKIQFLNISGKETRSLTLTESFSEYVRILNSDHLIVAAQRSFMSLDDDENKKGLAPLMQVLDFEGNTIRYFGEPRDYKHEMVNTTGNQVRFTIGENGTIYLVFRHQNRIEKYNSEGKILWQADRKLNYNAEKPISKGKMERSGGNVSINSPVMNRCSEAVAVDGKNRIWVITYNRQLKEEERASTSIRMSRSGGQSSISMAPNSDSDIRETDVYILEVFDSEGVLLGRIPLNHFADLIRISGDRLFILDKLRVMQVHEYKIVETGGRPD